MRNDNAFIEKANSSYVKMGKINLEFIFASNFDFTTASFLKRSNIISHLFAS